MGLERPKQRGRCRRHGAAQAQRSRSPPGIRRPRFFQCPVAASDVPARDLVSARAHEIARLPGGIAQRVVRHLLQSIDFTQALAAQHLLRLDCHVDCMQIGRFRAAIAEDRMLGRARLRRPLRVFALPLADAEEGGRCVVLLEHLSDASGRNGLGAVIEGHGDAPCWRLGCRTLGSTASSSPQRRKGCWRVIAAYCS